ncbi:IS110 family transposase [Lactococcus allomyrinae]|uniref:IS110 family transposase n=1 Tax=Lactococcus allomyrinae TaxID=2419773 RepID=A0A387BFV9_9LACT|nr:IS110 family transposase [Lactococcus allomyrinae]AYF99866.1 IS110 family transposase [Lactococcus allomyrinae]
MALKIVYPICCGIDVHKTFVVAVIAHTNDEGITEYIRRRFSTFTNNLKELKQWLEYYSCFDVCMESTGKYWIPIYNVLEDSCNICLAHPKYVKAIRGKKTDKKDAQWIADLYKHDLVSGSFIPPLKIRQLRDLFRYRMKLTQLQTSEKNRYQNCLTWSNIQIASVVSDVFGKSAQNIITSILDNPESLELEALMDRRMKATVEELTLATDCDITPEQANKLRVIKAHFDAITFCKNNLEQLITELGQEYEEQQKLIQTVPGFQKPLTALRILSEIGVDMSQFPTAGKLCSWAGVVPANNESAGKKFSTRISKGGHYLKPLLVEVANAVVRSEKNPELRNKYLQLKKRRGHKKAIMAICHRLLVAVYHVLKKNEVYNPELYQRIEYVTPDKTITLQEAARYAQSHGFKVI